MQFLLVNSEVRLLAHAVRLALGLALLIPIASAQTPNFLEDGMKALDAQKYDAAVDLFTKAIAADPQDYTAHFERGLAFSLQNKDAEAIAEYTRVLELKPGLYQAELNLGISLVRMGRAADAISHLRAAVDQKPDQLRPVFYLGNALLQAGQFADAEQAYTKALALDAKSAAAEVGLGRSVARQGRLKDAETHYVKAAALDPSQKDALLDLAARYESAKQPEAAVELYRNFPDNPGAQERMGALLVASGKPEEAVAPLEYAVAKSPSPANQLALAQAYASTKQPAKAEPLVARAVSAAPSDVELRMFYGRLLRDERKFPSAAEQFQAAAQAKPDLPAAWSELAGVLVMMEQYPQALGALDHVHDLHAEIAGHFFLRGMVLDRLHQPKDAMANYNQFLALSQGKNPDQEFQARQRVKTLEREVRK
jgi:tetratricopeptide (TPR) repeat protein